MKKLIPLWCAALVLIALSLTGCETLLSATDKVAYKMADAKEKYCAEADATVRGQIRTAYNAEMDKRGLPRDKIVCPGDAQ